MIWSTETWKAMRMLQNPDRGTADWDDLQDNNDVKPRFVEGVAFSPDGKILAMASALGTVHLWDVATGKLLETLKGHSSAVRAVVFSPDGRTLASGSTDQTVRLWNVETRRELMQLDPAGSHWAGCSHWIFLLTASSCWQREGTLRFWSTEP